MRLERIEQQEAKLTRLTRENAKLLWGINELENEKANFKAAAKGVKKTAEEMER